ncbi:hypothetical protein JOD54_000496 [Actinokineospora baliensis]|uniref:hypothetical protein n=1 Tax=Actinokineospora baliensis TaxID=547056 RepID=UPI001957227E|nr:hypothetical protein [Actinokineospora baliensis]MBM7770292.1 hypothetical protein [Actinokineospora baliensis]
MNEGFAESVAKFRAEVSAAVTAARRASAEARETSAAFRRDTQRLAAKSTSAPPEQARKEPNTPDDEDFSQDQILLHGG